ncbi:hypothetical protein [Bosea sp. BK604]|uniref:hypothetical protein n=1 Tax=Bosea sp. BK604 TaxID=2512180 RepID=UPI001045BF62|nr:hypothetical protein [Bosea sp. BK604]TCR66238.1 hypothetical protein EV560_104116 [Bosea sp. BK604]
MNSRDEKPAGKAANVNDAEAREAKAEMLRSDLSFAAMTSDEQDQHQLKVAEYIQSMCIELRAMAQGAELEGLAYFIDMARLEASTQVENRKSKTDLD